MAEAQNLRDARRRANVGLTAGRSLVPAAANRVQQLKDDRRFSEETKREQLATARGEAGASGRGAVSDVRATLSAHIPDADARIAAARWVAPEVLNQRREALRPFLDRAFEDRSVLVNLYRNNFSDLAARRVIEEHVELFRGSGHPEATALAEDFRGLKEELAPQLPEAELQALEDREALGEIVGYLDAGAELLEAELAGLGDEGASTEQRMNRPFREADVNSFEQKYSLPSSQPPPSA